MAEFTAEGGYTDEQLDGIRAEAKQVILTDFPSNAAAAKDAGVAYQTFSAFLAGTYNGNNDKVGADVQKWLRARRERVHAVAAKPTVPGFVMIPTAAKIIPICQYAQMAPDFAVVVGAPGIGKTFTLDHYRTNNPNVWLATMEPATGSTGTMLRELARVMGVDERSNAELSHSIKRRVKGTQGLLIVDEAQHLETKALDQLRTIYDVAKIGIVVAGNETLYARIDGGSRKPELGQLFSRVGMRMTQRQPAAGDVCMLIQAWGVTVDEEVKYLKVISRKPGALRNITKVMTLATLLANGASDERSLRHIRAAWEQLAGADIRPEAA